MQRYLRMFNYGNADISGPIDQFWLNGPLRISPRQQTEFVHRMLSGQLPVDPAHVKLVWATIGKSSATRDFIYRGKTGLGSLDGRVIGWLVGYVERQENRWIFATFVRSLEDADQEIEFNRFLSLRQQITRKLLERAEILPQNEQ